ncbi:M20 peptidase aminoacylase family protein [Scopulibacillus cellulosilyticus]|uniref:M20 peptidase aminoacylase family protein n=1 Tax=Scopulibacillus cellulosilyticus TaxID=2665665 RepID=A0ABW2Q0A1_9BACL
MHFLSEQSQTIIKTYNDLHQIAEPSWSEKKTSYYIYQFLKRLGMEIKTFDNHYGIVAEIPGEIEEVVACRADMDALVQEVDGVVQPNHSCGHDAHSTMVMYAALAIAKSNIQPKRTIRFIFQPAEEKAGGAVQMMKDGALENVKTLFGIHLRPHMEVPDGKASAVIIHGSSVNLTGKIKGVQAHASRPEEGINAIEAAAFVVQCLKEIHLDTSESFSIKMTQLQTGGNASNVIPESATFTLDLRAQTNEAMDKLKEKAELILEHVSKLSGTSIDWKFEEFVPAASPNENAMKLAQEAIEEILGQENFVPVCISKGGEDFHFYTFEHPEIEATMIGLGCDLRPGLHHPKMTFNVNSLINGAQILTKALIKAAER